MAQQLAQIGDGRDIKKDDVAEGIKEQEKTVRKQLERQFGKEYEVKAAEYVGKAITKLAKSGNDEKEKIAMSLLYAAKTGEGLGAKDFSEFYKKK